MVSITIQVIPMSECKTFQAGVNHLLTNTEPTAITAQTQVADGMLQSLSTRTPTEDTIVSRSDRMEQRTAEMRYTVTTGRTIVRTAPSATARPTMGARPPMQHVCRATTTPGPTGTDLCRPPARPTTHLPTTHRDSGMLTATTPTLPSVNATIAGLV